MVTHGNSLGRGKLGRERFLAGHEAEKAELVQTLGRDLFEAFGKVVMLLQPLDVVINPGPDVLIEHRFVCLDVLDDTQRERGILDFLIEDGQHLRPY